MLAIISALIFGIFFLPFTGLDRGYSDGERTGDVYKFSKKGIIYKSWEGEMYLGGVSSDSNGSLQVDKFYFSIPDSQETDKKDLIAKLQQCVQTRTKHCTVKYIQWLSSPAYISSDYEVTDVVVGN